MVIVCACSVFRARLLWLPLQVGGLQKARGYLRSHEEGRTMAKRVHTTTARKAIRELHSLVDTALLRRSGASLPLSLSPPCQRTPLLMLSL